VALAVLMPIVASMGGNAGTQTMTVAVRALAMQDLGPANALRVILRESAVGVLLFDDLGAHHRGVTTSNEMAQKYFDQGMGFAYGFNHAAAIASFREAQKQDAWELGVRHALGAPWTLLARATRSFRFVNAEEIYESDATGDNQFQILRPQHARTWESGAEWRENGRALRATLFRMDVFDEIHLDPFTTGVGNTNLPPSRRQGLELDGRWKWLKVAYAYTDAKFLEGTLEGSPFAIGTNIELTRLIGNILQDEKFPGIHIAFGNPYGVHTGADWHSSTHIDVVGTEFDIWVDDTQLMQRGTFLVSA